MKKHSIVLLPGDGIGPEVTSAARLVLEEVADVFGHHFEFSTHDIGGAAIDRHGDPLPNATREACVAASAVFLGAVGGPKWDGAAVKPEAGLLGLRKAMGLFANMRPVAVEPFTAAHSPLKAEVVRGVDLLIVRELTGGAYFGEKSRTPERASDSCVYTREEIERVARVAFRAAEHRRGHVTSVDKANVMETGRLWRETVTRIGREEFPKVKLEHALVDSTAMQLILKPRAFDVIPAENMFGDILSDEAAVLTGSIGLLGSASLGAGGPGMFEPIHGSAPDIAGQDVANPAGALMSVAMLLRYGLGLAAEGDLVEHAVRSVLGSGKVTRDLGGSMTCSAFAKCVADSMRGARWAAMHMGQMHWA